MTADEFARSVLPDRLYSEWRGEVIRQGYKNRLLWEESNINKEELISGFLIWSETAGGSEYWCEVNEIYKQSSKMGKAWFDLQLFYIENERWRKASKKKAMSKPVSKMTGQLVREELKRYRGVSADLGGDFYSEDDRIGY